MSGKQKLGKSLWKQSQNHVFQTVKLHFQGINSLHLILCGSSSLKINSFPLMFKTGFASLPGLSPLTSSSNFYFMFLSLHSSTLLPSSFSSHILVKLWQDFQMVLAIYWWIKKKRWWRPENCYMQFPWPQCLQKDISEYYSGIWHTYIKIKQNVDLLQQTHLFKRFWTICIQKRI